MPDPRCRAKQMPGRASSLAALVAVSILAGCGSTSGGDPSPIPSTGVPMAARDARGVKVADQAAPLPTTQSDQDPFGVDPFGGNHPPTVIPPPQAPPPQAPPMDPFAAPPDAPSATPPLTPPPPKPPPTGVPL